MVPRRRRRTGSLLLASVLAAAALVVVMRPDAAHAAGLANLPSCQTAGQACVAVKVVKNGQQVSLTFTPASALAGDGADVENQGYAIPSSAPAYVTRGMSVAHLIAAAGVNPGDVRFAEVDLPDGYGRHLLTGGELGPPTDDTQAPAFYPNPAGNADDTVNFIRANRGGGDDQQQGGPDLGSFRSDPDGAVMIVVHLSGQPIDPVTVTATAVPGGDGRSFDLVSNPGGGGNLTTTWVYPDGTTSTDATPRYTFPDSTPAGSWPISVAVENPGDGSFGGGTTMVRIGAPSTAPTGPTAAPGTGGNGHGHNGANQGHDNGSNNPNNGKGNGGSDGPTSRPSSRPSSGASTGPTAGPSTLAPVLPTSQPSSSLYVPPTSGALNVPSPRDRPTPTPTPTPSDSSSGPTEDLAAGDAVSGVLLTGALALPSSQGQILDAPAPTAAAAPALDPHFRVDPLVWLGVGGALLLAAGALSESDRVRRRLRRWARIGA